LKDWENKNKQQHVTMKFVTAGNAEPEAVRWVVMQQSENNN
jgi:hypothetical protein